MKLELPVEPVKVKRLRGIDLTVAREKAGLSQQDLATLLGGAEAGWYQRKVARLEGFPWIEGACLEALLDLL